MNYQDIIDQLDSYNNTKQGEIDKLKSEKEHLKADYEFLRQEAHRLQEKLKEVTERKDCLYEALGNWEAVYNDSISKIKELEKKLNARNEDVEYLEKLVAELKGGIEDVIFENTIEVGEIWQSNKHKNRVVLITQVDNLDESTQELKVMNLKTWERAEKGSCQFLRNNYLLENFTKKNLD